MNRRCLTKIVLLPVAVMPLFIFGCKANYVKAEIITYRDVLIEDLTAWFNTDRSEEDHIYIQIDEIVPYFMADNGTIVFSAFPDHRGSLCEWRESYPARFDDELILYFDKESHIPFVWNKHSIIDLSYPWGVPDDILTHEEGIRIQEVYDTKAFDYSILDLTYSEEN